MRSKLLLGVGILAFGAGGNAVAAVVMTYTQTKLDSRQTNPVTVYVESDRLKVETPDSTMIYRADQNRMWVIDMQKRSYMEMTPETMQQFGGQMAGLQSQMGAAQAAMEAQIAQLPPDQQAMMRQMMGARGGGGMPGMPGAGRASAPPQTAYARAGGNKTIANWACDGYRKTVNGQPDEELCIAPIARVGMNAGDFQVMEQFSTFIAPIANSPMTPRNSTMSWSDMNRAIGFQGVPLDTISYVQGRPSTQQTVTKIERTTIPAATFNLPPGLTRQDMGGISR